MSDACRFEANVIHAARHDAWSESLRAHLTTCEECEVTAAIAPWMTRFERMPDREHILPDPQVVWLKAQILRGTADALRVTRPLNIMQIAAYLVVAGGWAALLTWKWDVLRRWLSSLAPEQIVFEASGGQATLSVSFFGIVFVLASVTVMLALHTILAEE
ncbi:MAG TPA: hypothetical protein VF618_00720 [Thermoanaerobaculia bacterium]